MSKPIYLLDTNIISELGKVKPNPAVVEKVAENKSQCAISSTTWNELLFGLQNMDDGKKKDFYFRFIVDYIQSEFPIIQYDNHAAWIHADIRSRLKFEAIQKVDSVFYMENWFV